MQQSNPHGTTPLSATDWLPEALSAIELTRVWAEEVQAATQCQVYLFGSSIYKGGEQFNSAQSDLDIVCLFPEGADALVRHNIVVTLKAYKLSLEVRMIPELRRDSCTEPGVSIVALTSTELRTNVHKSGVRRFWDRNYFYDFSIMRARILEEAGTQYIPDEGRHAMEYVQKIRNDYLAVAANHTGGLKPFSGVDPMPKALLRNAAQLNSDAQDGEWYDTMLGLELLRSRLRELRARGGIFQQVADCVAVRSGARGHRRAISAEEQLLLAEILLDEAMKVNIENALTIHLKIEGVIYSAENVQELFGKIKSFVPGVKLTGHRPGSIIIQIEAPKSSVELLEKLQNHDALRTILEVGSVQVVRGTFEESMVEITRVSRTEILTTLIKAWRPSAPIINGRDAEHQFMNFLIDAMSANSSLEGADIRRDVYMDTAPKFQLDFIVSWRNPDGSYERMGIETKIARGPAALFDTLTRFRVLGQKVVLVLFGGESLLELVAKDLAGYAKINANVEVIAVPIEHNRTTL